MLLQNQFIARTTKAVVLKIVKSAVGNVPNAIICVGAYRSHPFHFVYTLYAPGPTYKLDSETAKLLKFVNA